MIVGAIPPNGVTRSGYSARFCANAPPAPSPGLRLRVNILAGTFPASRFLFNVYCHAATCGNSKVASVWTTKFIGEGGFLCKNETKFNTASPPNNPILDPITHAKYRGAPDASSNPTGEIPDTISSFGFVPLKKQGTGSYCITQNT